MNLKQRNKTPPPHLALKSLLFMTQRERDEQLMKSSSSSSSSSGSGYSSSLKVLLLIVVSILVPISLVAYLVGINQNLLFWFPSSSSSTLLLLSNGKFTYNHHQLLIPGEVEVNKTVLLDEYQPLMKVEASLAYARALIKEAFHRQNNNSSTTLLPPHKQQEQEDLDYVPNGEIYRNPHVFHRSYLLMEKIFKIFVYEEGEPPLFHTGPCKGIYSMEGIFISLLEMEDRFRTSDPDQAHVYFLPFSVAMIIKYLFHPIIRDKAVLQRTVVDYVRIISEKYPYWNRSFGADHFMLSCHDWGPRATWYVPQLYYNSIRVLCNANTSERFNPKKDASFPEINLKTGELTGLIGGPPPSSRPILAFFAGRMHGRIRGPLFQHWKVKDEDLRIYEQLPEGINYNEMMNKSKYCICPSGHEVASPRIVEAIYAECVPVLISQHYVLPFNDVLDWNSFSVQVSVNEIPNLKKILMEIPQDQYEKLQGNVKRVQRHFVVNDPPKRYDVFHMIIHSIWLRRLNFHII